MEKARRQEIRQRAKRIKKAQTKLTTKDYLQRAIVVMVIVLILAAALFVYNNMR